MKGQTPLQIRLVLATDTEAIGEAVFFALEQYEIVASVQRLRRDDRDSLVRSVGPIDAALLHVAVEDGSWLVARLRAACPELPIIAFGVQEAPRTILTWAAAGVQGCILQDATLDDILAAVRATLRGETACSPAVAAPLFARYASILGAMRNARPLAGSRLTQRETEIARLVADGLSNKEVARRLVLQVPTVKNHLRSIFKKLDIRTRNDLAIWWLAAAFGD